MTAQALAVELDVELVLEASGDYTWQDFGTGSPKALREVKVARGRWLILLHGWVGQRWQDPIHRLQVGLCEEPPNLDGIPEGGGIGYWVELHAAIKLLEPN